MLASIIGPKLPPKLPLPLLYFMPAVGIELKVAFTRNGKFICGKYAWQGQFLSYYEKKVLIF